MSGFVDDLRLALRSFRRRPALSALVVVVFALGIASGTAVYSIVRTVLLKPLPFPEPERLVRIEARREGEPGRVSMLEIEELREMTEVFDGVGGYVPGFSYNLNTDDRPQQLAAITATRDLFSVLGVTPLVGTVWPEDYDWTRSFGLVLSHRIWRNSFHSDAEVVGSRVFLDGAPYTVFGVLPRGFDFPSRTDIYRSVFILDSVSESQDRRRRRVIGIARLASGVSLDEARAQLRSVAATLAELYPDTHRDVGLEAVPLRETYISEVRVYAVLLSGAVLLVLLIACVNATNLLLSRVVGRSREIALRAALGAGRRRLIQHVLIECLLLAVAGGVLGLWLAGRLIEALVALVRFDLPPWMTVSVDGPVMAFAFLLALLCGVLAGVVPALRASSSSGIGTLRGDAGALAGGRSQRRMRSVLVVAEIALSVTLLVGAGLVMRSFMRIMNNEVGFATERVLTFRVSLTWLLYRDDDRVRSFHRQFLDRLSALPGVESAALASSLPLTQVESRERNLVIADGQSEDEWKRNPSAALTRVSRGYRGSLDIPLFSGRDFDSRDGPEAPLVVMISRGLAETLWPDTAPVGQRVRLGSESADWRTVVGVVGEVKHRADEADTRHDIYLPSPQPRPPDNFFVVMKTSVDPMTLADSVVAAIRAVDPDQAAYDVQSMESRLLESVWQHRVVGYLFAIFALLALGLAMSGLYGVMATNTRERTGEMGIRMAMGADRGSVLRLVLGQSIRLCSAGLGIGLAVALALSRLLGSILFEIGPFDPLTFLTVAAALAPIAFLASLLPALRASRTEPTVALRHD